MNYKIVCEADYTQVIVRGMKTTTITFEGLHHKKDAMVFVAEVLMVQMGQIGY